MVKTVRSGSSSPALCGGMKFPRKSEIFSFIINTEELFGFDRIQLCRLSCKRVPEMCQTIAKIFFPIRSSRPVNRICNLRGPIRQSDLSWMADGPGIRPGTVFRNFSRTIPRRIRWHGPWTRRQIYPCARWTDWSSVRTRSDHQPVPVK